MSYPIPDPAALLDELEQRARDQAQPSGGKVWGQQIGLHTFLPVLGLARFWESATPGAPEVDYAQHMADVLAGLHGPGRTVRSFIAGTPEGVALYLGLEIAHGPPADPLPALLRGVFPGIELGAPATQFARALDARGLFAAVGMMTGIPTVKLNPDPQRGRGVALQIERLLRGLSGATWGYLVVAEAVPGPTARAAARRVQEQVRAVSPLVKQQVSTQSAHKVQGAAGVGTVSESAERLDAAAQRCLELLQRQAQRLDEAQANGLWQTLVYCFGSDEPTRDRAAALLRAVFAGPESLPEPVRTYARAGGPGQADRDSEFATFLTGREVAALCQLPREEFPGYALRDYARFDSDLPRPRPQDAVTLGRVLDGGNPTGHDYTLERRDLTKHGLVAGVTGSGKTTTVFSLLDQVHRGGQGAPFLVIEPAKSEYRSLLRAGRFPGLRVFTLGDERHAPFRLNPFAFAIGDAQHRIHVQTHIDHLKAVFNAAFVLYAPMPYVLESCLHEVYTDKGWDLATSTNNRLPPAQHGREAQWPVFPTLTDLYRKVDAVVDRLGYEERIEMDVKAGLKARIGSLRLGGKGFMLDTQRSFPMDDLLAHPTVLEMAPVGNEDEKAFLLGLLLTALYEHHIVRAQMAAQPPAGLVHMTVLEEAHRLLKNVSTQQDTESANTRGQAVETFTNMLSEIRSYGEGVIIAEQIPTKLAPDAVKNTNLKIVHRLLAGDDRAALAATMNMDEAQSRFLTTLRAGQAAVFAEGADHPYLVAMADFKAGLAGGRVADADVRAAMAAVCAGPVYDPVPDFAALFPAALVQVLAGQGSSLPAVRNRAVQLLDHPGFQPAFDRYVLGIVEQPEQGVRGFARLRRMAQEKWARDDTALLRPLLLYALPAAVEDHAMRRGQHYQWPYHHVGNAYAPLRRALGQVARDYPYDADDAHAPALLDQLWAAVEADLRAFQAAYVKLTQAHAPYAGCSACATRCRYRVEAAQAAAQRDLREEFEQLFAHGGGDPQAFRARLAEHCRDGAFQVVGVAKADLPADAVHCYALHAAREQRLSRAAESSILASLRAAVKP